MPDKKNEHHKKNTKKTGQRLSPQQLSDEAESNRNQHTALESLEKDNKNLLAENSVLSTQNQALSKENDSLRSTVAQYQFNTIDIDQEALDEKNLLDNTGISAIFFDKDIKIRKFTSSATLPISLDKHSIGNPLEGLTHSFEKVDFYACASEVLRHGQQFELELKTHNGTFYSTKFSPYISAQNEINGVIISFTPIESNNDTNEQVENVMRRLTLALEASNVGVWEWDLLTNDLVWDKQMYALYGIKAAEFEGTYPTWEKGLHPDDKERSASEVQAAAQGKGMFDTEFRVVWPSGEVRNIRALANVIRNASGDPIKMIGVNWDITVSKNYENKLKESNLRYELMTKGASVGIWDWFDVNKNEAYWSPKLYELLGFSDKEIESSVRNFHNIIHSDDQKRNLELLNDHFNHGIIFDIEYRLRIKTGEYKWFRGSGLASRDSQGNPQRMVGSIQDIHDRKVAEIKQRQQEIKLKHLNEKLIKSNEDLERFAYITSHDLKAPLRGINNIREFILEDLDDFIKTNHPCVDSLKQNLQRLERQVKRMEALIRGILDYSRIESGCVNLKNISMTTLIEEVAFDHQLKIGKNIFLPEQKISIRTDEVKLRQVFSNLISNAFKYHHDIENAVVHIICLEQEEESFLKFEVRDNGPGIDSKYHKKIFEMFQTLQSRDKIESTGVGLTIVKKIVETFGGEVNIQSAEGDGSRFIFTWPKHITRQRPDALE